MMPEERELVKVRLLPCENVFLAGSLLLRNDNRFDAILVCPPPPFYSHIFKSGINGISQLPAVAEHIDNCLELRLLTVCRNQILENNQGKFVKALKMAGNSRTFPSSIHLFL